LILHRVSDQLIELQALALELDFVSRDAGHVEEIAGQSFQLSDLSLDDRLDPACLFIS
jgi:hypothetical protein